MPRKAAVNATEATLPLWSFTSKAYIILIVALFGYLCQKDCEFHVSRDRLICLWIFQGLYEGLEFSRSSTYHEKYPKET